ncbi:unnamed protein product [Dicrocoelium dendriticum]|nr:unnamed protein product [Dicrocoelium dendriticum]
MIRSDIPTFCLAFRHTFAMADGNTTNTEVTVARELLDSIMGKANAHVTYPFMKEIDPDALGLQDYRKIVTEPIWLEKMAEKFSQGYYQNIREFVCDFRLMLFNCYRYNGIASRMGRSAEKLELLFEQKLQLMSPEIRLKTSIHSTLGCGSAEDELTDSAANGLSRRRSSTRLFLSGDSRQLTPMRSIMEELEHALQPDGGGFTASLITGGLDSLKHGSSGPIPTSFQSPATASTSEARASILLSRLLHWRVRRQEEALLSSWNTWWLEQKGPEIMDILNHTSELLEAYQFLWLSDPFLGITDFMAYSANSNGSSVTEHSSSNIRGLCLFDLELGLAVAPQASQLLAICMSNLLATPKERNQIVSTLSSKYAAESGDSSNAGLIDGLGHRRPRNNQQCLSNSLTPLEYDVWERRLSERVASWYRTFWDKGKGYLPWAIRRIGLPPTFFARCGSRVNPLESRRFHELPPYVRIQLLHALCETVLRTFENLRQSLDREADWDAAKPVSLGSDLFSNVNYLHFPGCLDSESASICRVYRVGRTIPGPVEVPGRSSISEATVPSESLLASSKSHSSTSEEKSDDGAPNTPVESHRLVKRRKRRQNRVTKVGRLGGKQKSAMLEHDRLISELGLEVSGPVARLPCWMDPSLQRSICRRLYKIAEQLQAANQPLTLLAPKPGGRRKSQLSRSSSVASSFGAYSDANDSLTTIQSNRIRGRTSITGSNKMPFPTFLRVDTQKIKEMVDQDPALSPSPFGLLSGLSRRHLSLQAGRHHPGLSRGGSKSASSRRSKSITDHEAPQVDEADSSTTTSQCDAEEVQSSLSDQDSTNEQRKSDRDDEFVCDDMIQDTPRALVKNMEDEMVRPEDQQKSEHWLDQLSSSSGLVRTSSCLKQEETDNEHKTEEGFTKEAPGPPSNPNPIGHTPDSSNSTLELADRSKQYEEEFVCEPDRSAFSLVAQDPNSLRDLIAHIQRILEAAIRRWESGPIADPDPNEESSSIPSPQSTCSSESDENVSGSVLPPKCRRPGGAHGAVGRLTPRDRRFSRAIRRLRLLIANLERLHSSMSLRQTELGDAQQLARLRLRKDVLAWLAREEDRRNSKSTEPTISSSAQSGQSDLVQSGNLAKERAERLRRREQLRVLDDDEEDHTTAPNPNPTPVSCTTSSISEPTQATCTAADVTVQQPLGSTTIPVNRSPPPMAFSWRFDKSGSPKIPIFPTKPTVSFRSTTVNQVSSKSDYIATIPTTSPHISLRFRIAPWSGSQTSQTPAPASLSGPSARTNGLTSNATSVLFANTTTISKPAPLPASSLSAPPQMVPTNTQPDAPSNSSSTSPSITDGLNARKVYRVYDTLFTEDACPVRIDADGSIRFLPVDSIPLLHRQLARQMIARYKQFVHNSVASPSSAPPAKRVAVTTGDQTTT